MNEPQFCGILNEYYPRLGWDLRLIPMPSTLIMTQLAILERQVCELQARKGVGQVPSQIAILDWDL